MEKEDINLYIQCLMNEQSSIKQSLVWVDNLEQAYIKRIESANNLILVLAIGIVGNFFATFSYSLFVSFSNSNYSLFYVNITGFIITLSILVLIINYYFKQRKSAKEYPYHNLEESKAALKGRLTMIPYEIEELKKKLESNP
jgi:uncharacterized membrane protein YeaQ/YmgE (transglycosylase-associated protein family)